MGCFLEELGNLKEPAESLDFFQGSYQSLPGSSRAPRAVQGFHMLKDKKTGGKMEDKAKRDKVQSRVLWKTCFLGSTFVTGWCF